jgi:hypothetical protein
MLDFFGTTVMVSEATQIRVAGQPRSLNDIQEGARVKATYEVRYEVNVGRAIDVTPRAGAAQGSQ